MDENERKAWIEVITPESLDEHLARVGQAQANAEITRQMFCEHPLQNNSSLLIAGAGTGQLFDYINPVCLGRNIELVLTDINHSMLSKAQERMERLKFQNYKMQCDDIEQTKLMGAYEAVLLVLVLQHVEWEKALDSLCALKPNRFYIIEQDLRIPAVTQSAQLSGPFKRYSEMAHVKLIPRNDLLAKLSQLGYLPIGEYGRNVQDNKTMYGFVFGRK